MTRTNGTGRRKSRRQARPAFTLVELVITVLIIGILATVTIPRFGKSVTHFQLRSAAKQIIADLEYARQYAKKKGKSQAVVFTPAAETYELSGVADVNHSAQPYLVNLTKTPYPAELVAVSFGPTGTDSTVNFDMRGNVDYGGSVVASVGSQQLTIVVNALTGKASIQ